MKELTAFSNLTVAAVLIAAVELTVIWNNIPNVNWFTDVAQTLPVFLSAGIVVRTVFLHFATGDDDSGSEQSSSVRESRRSYGSYPSRRWGPAGPAGPPRPPPPAAQRM